MQPEVRMVKGPYLPCMTLDLTEEETGALASLLSRTIGDDRYPLSPRIQITWSIPRRIAARRPCDRRAVRLLMPITLAGWLQIPPTAPQGLFSRKRPPSLSTAGLPKDSTRPI
jgi:hypothetical protein